MIDKIKTWVKGPEFREMVVYGVVGVLTTVINYLSYIVLTDWLGAGMNLALTISWLLSVLFAFVANKKWVFRTPDWTGQALLREGISFLTARLLSLGFDYAFMNVSVSIFGMNDKIAKLLSNVLVIILNYFASKLWIFKKK